jgi:hypothetical protein
VEKTTIIANKLSTAPNAMDGDMKNVGIISVLIVNDFIFLTNSNFNINHDSFFKFYPQSFKVSNQ